MRRTALVLSAAAVMVAVLVALSAPALADDGRDRHNDGRNHHNAWNNHHNWNDWGHHNRFDRFDHDRDLFFINDFEDDCEWEFEEGWFFGFWGWQWGWWFLDC